MQFLINGLVVGCIYTLVALGFSLVYRVSRFLDFGQAAIFTVTAYSAYAIKVQAGFKFWQAVVLASAIGILLGCVVDGFIYRPLRKVKGSGASLFLVSLGVYIIAQNLVSIIWGDNTKTLRSGSVNEGFNFLGARITGVQISIVIVAVALLGFLALVMRSRFGVHLRALADDSSLANVFGLRIERLAMGAAALASFLSGSAALLLTLEVDLTPSGGFRLLVMGMISAILGGLRSLSGAAMGGILLGLAQNIGVLWFPAKWQDGIAFIILILCLILRPEGIMGGVLKREGRMLLGWKGQRNSTG